MINWEMNGVSAEKEEVFAEINHELPRPLGVVLFGADSSLKAGVYKQLRGGLAGSPLALRQGIGSAYARQAKEFLAQGRPILIRLSGDESVHHGLRHKCVKQLEELGAKSVVGVYAKATDDSPIDYAMREVDSTFDYPQYRRQIKKLLDDPPSPDGLDCFIVVEDDRDRD